MESVSSSTDWVYPDHCFASDRLFDLVYPEHVSALSDQHWTPIHVARRAARFLAPSPGSKVLDVGSGNGKFCLSAAYYQPEGLYYGVEQRGELVRHAEETRNKLAFNNVFFIHGNFTQLNFAQFDHFYFYNAFYENLPGTEKIDNSITYSEQLYHYYNRYLHQQLEQKPAGTRLVTFNSLEYEVPKSYFVVETALNDLLKCWVKI